MKKILFLGFTLLTNLAFGQVEMSDTTRELIISNLCKSLKDNYVFPEMAKTLSDSINSYNYNGKYASVKGYNEFASLLTKDLRKINNDKHIRILYDLELENDIIKFISSSKDANVVSEIEISKDKSKNFHFKKIEILPSNIGYIELNGFALPSKYTSNTIFSAMYFVANTNAVILDLRNNFGGNSNVANEILSYFFSEKKFLGRSYNRIEDKWTNQYVLKRSKSEKGISLKMPIYILTSERTFSAAEGLSYNLQQFRDAVIVGDTTRGGAHLTRSFSIGNGFVAFIPFSRSENAKTKTDWEGTGVLPNIVSDEKNALIEAQLHFLNQKLLSENNEEEQRKIKYTINYLISTTGISLFDKSLYESLIGSYEYYNVTFENNQMLFMDTKNHKKPIVMTPISDTMFQIGLDYQVEFKINEKGVYDVIQMYWNDGWTEVIERVK